MKPFERLEAWKHCHALALEIYRVTEAFPASELYGLTRQLRRAAYSAGANLAEGAAKRGPREFARFLDISVGSLSEIAYALLLARDLTLVSEAEWQRLDAIREDASRLTWRLYQAIRRSI